MDYQIIRLLAKTEADRFVAELAQSEFKDGKLTAGGQARDVKNNLQLLRSYTGNGDLHNRMAAAFQASAELKDFTFAKRFVCPTFNRYEPGMAYGDHVDNAIMGGFSGVRSDFSITVFLSPPADYEGGELVIRLPSGEEAVKLDAGEAIVYPSGTVHHVAPVTGGVRLAAISWIQSAVKDAGLRDILKDLTEAIKRAQELKDSELTLLLCKSQQNLLRYAADS